MIATSVNQSKTLIELGIDVNTADMHYSKWDNNEEEEYHLKCGGLSKLEFKYATNIPAWSLSALIELIPSSTLDISNDHWGRIRCSDRFTNWCMSPLDAAFEMVCYLLENKMIK